MFFVELTTMTNSSDNISGPCTSDTQASSSGSESSISSIFTAGDTSEGARRTSRLVKPLQAPLPQLPIPADRDRPDPNKPLYLQTCLSLDCSDDLLRRDPERFRELQYRRLYEEKLRIDKEHAMETGYPCLNFDKPPAPLDDSVSAGPYDVSEHEDNGMDTDFEDNDSDSSAHAEKNAPSSPFAKRVPFVETPATPLVSTVQSSEPPTRTCMAKVLERELELAAAELSKAALGMRHFRDRRNLRIAGGANPSKMRGHSLLKEGRQYGRPVAQLRPCHRPAPPVAGPSSVTIEDMLEMERKKKAEAAMQQLEDNFPSPPMSKMRGKARALAKGKGRAF